MKLILRIFNFVIMGLSLAAAIMLFAMPAFSFNSKIAIDVEAFSKFVPETQYTKDVKIVDLIGTDVINVGVKFQLNAGEIVDAMDGSREKINDRIVAKSADDIITTMHEPVDLITDYSIRTIMKSTIKSEITKQVDEARKKFGSDSSAEDIMQEVGMNDKYFTNFSNELFSAADKDDATVNGVSNTLYGQIQVALEKSEESGMVDNSGFTEDKKVEINNNLVKVLNDLKLVEDGGKLKRISQISYIYLSEYIKGQLNGKVDSALLEQKSNETAPQYSDRLLKLFVTSQMPDGFYQIVGYVSLGLFIGLFIFTALWLFLLVFTLLRTFSKKPWTIFGPWFWVLGFLQVVLGLGLTVAFKFMLPKLNIALGNIPLKQVILAPRTYALVPSILYLVCIVLAIVYLVFKIMVKHEMKEKGEI